MAFQDFTPIEPLRQNRFLIHLIGQNIPDFVFRNFKIYNDGDKLIFETEFYETVQFSYNPKDFFNIMDAEIDFLDPTGMVISELKFSVKGSNFEKSGDYSEDGLLINKLKFIIDKESLILTHKSQQT